MCVCKFIYTEIYFLSIMGATSSKAVGQISRLEIQVHFWVKALRQNNSFFSGKPQILLLRPPADWMSFTHMFKGNFS